MLNKFLKYSLLSTLFFSPLSLSIFYLSANSINNQSLTSSADLDSLEPSDFISNPVANNQIYNEGGPNYQYQSILSESEVNDPTTFNRNSVLSSKSIQTVRNEHYYFNFIKSPGVTTYHIMVTPVDPSSLINPIKVPTVYTEMNGSVLWIENHLVIIGSQNNDVVLSVYSQNLDNGQLFNLKILRASQNVYPQLFALQNQTKKLIETWPNATSPTEAIPYYTYQKPIYLSPVEDFSDSENTLFSVVAWVGGYTFTQLSTNNITPVLVSYDWVNEKFEIKEKLSFNLPGVDISMPINPEITEQSTLFEREIVLNAKIAALSPVINEKNELKIYIHSFNATVTNAWCFFAEYIIDGSDLKTVKFSEDVVRVAGGFEGNNIQRDSMNYIPYGMFAKGEINPTTLKQDLNLFFLFTPDVVQATLGVGTNFIIGLDSQELIAPPQQQINFYQNNGPIFTNFLFTEQIYYPPERDLISGIHIGIRYRGVGTWTGVSRIGTLKWQTPWNPATWSNEAAWYGTTIVNGYGATVESTFADVNNSSSNIYPTDIAPTVWNGIYSAPGIYEAQIKPDTPGSLPTLPAKRQGTTTLMKNLATNFNTFETVIPQNITISFEEALDPNIIGVNGIETFIEKYSQDFPNISSSIEISELNFVSNEYLAIQGLLLNPYINGTQSLTTQTIPINLKIQYPPSKEEILNPVKINSNNLKLQLPSSILVPINEVFQIPGVPNEVEHIIGLSNNELVQIIPAMAPYFTSFKASSNDFLGSLKLEYEIQSVNGQIIKQEIMMNGFWGHIYIIVIILSSIILITIIILLTLFILKKKHKNELTLSISKGFNLYKLNHPNSSKKTALPKVTLPPPPSFASNKTGNKLPPNKKSPNQSQKSLIKPPSSIKK